MKVISLKNIERFYKEGQTEIFLNEKEIMTPSAKDFLKTKGIKVVYSKDSLKKKGVKIDNDSDEEVVEHIISILVNKYNITDSESISKIVLRALKEIKK